MKEWDKNKNPPSSCLSSKHEHYAKHRNIQTLALPANSCSGCFLQVKLVCSVPRPPRDERSTPPKAFPVPPTKPQAPGLRRQALLLPRFSRQRLKSRRWSAKFSLKALKKCPSSPLPGSGGCWCPQLRGATLQARPPYSLWLLLFGLSPTSL